MAIPMIDVYEIAHNNLKHRFHDICVTSTGLHSTAQSVYAKRIENMRIDLKSLQIKISTQKVLNHV